jgi:peptidoglycan/xylan/chitin deacetylase (PgdA/CDA1 family)
MLKKLAAGALVCAGADVLGRWRNRHKLVVVMYHGVTQHAYQPPVWTQLPEAVFRRQMEFIARAYRPVSLQQVLRAIDREELLPERAVLITFDDGLRNNATVAWPILRQMGMPATIFLTVDFIGSDRFFWVDELYMYLLEAVRSGKEWPLADIAGIDDLLQSRRVWDAYFVIVEQYKRIPESVRQERMADLSTALPFDRSPYQEDFGLMDWRQVTTLYGDGAIDFGVHTATHQILTQMDTDEIERELIASKKNLEERLGHRVKSFCYPNGRQGCDFLPEHEQLLREIGYACAFATDKNLFDPAHDNPYAIGRVPAGNDIASDSAFFRMSMAGILAPKKKQNIEQNNKG